MHAVSQVIVRNLNRLPDGPLLLVDAPADGLWNVLQANGKTVRVSTQSYGVMRDFKRVGVNVSYEAVPVPPGDIQTVILVLPREKERLDMLLQCLASALTETARLWLVGENRAGIKSSTRPLGEAFARIQKLDSARHCSLFEAAGPHPTAPFLLGDSVQRWTEHFGGQSMNLVSLPGVFAHGRLDKGTECLLAELARLRPGGRVLDFGCGNGVIATFVMCHDPSVEATLLDDSALALEAARRTLAENGFQADLVASDGLAEVSGRFDWIVSNPPFHRGVRNDLDVAQAFFRNAGTFLSDGGKMLVVYNAHLPYGQWLHSGFQHVETRYDDGVFKVMMLSKPK